jgi:hypothetical protein
VLATAPHAWMLMVTGGESPVSATVGWIARKADSARLISMRLVRAGARRSARWVRLLAWRGLDGEGAGNVGRAASRRWVICFAALLGDLFRRLAQGVDVGCHQSARWPGRPVVLIAVGTRWRGCFRGCAPRLGLLECRIAHGGAQRARTASWCGTRGMNACSQPLTRSPAACGRRRTDGPHVAGCLPVRPLR